MEVALINDGPVTLMLETNPSETNPSETNLGKLP